MKTLTSLLRRALVVAALALCVMRTNAADSADLGQPAGSVTVPAGLSQTEIQDAIVATLLGREWGVSSKSDGRVVGYLKHRSNEATVTLVYTDTTVDLFCVGYQIDKKTGAREKPDQPKSWLNNLKSDLAKKFTRATSIKK